MKNICLHPLSVPLPPNKNPLPSFVTSAIGRRIIGLVCVLCLFITNYKLNSFPGLREKNVVLRKVQSKRVEASPPEGGATATQRTHGR